MVFELSLQAWAVAALAVLLTGVSKSGFGSALGGIAVPMLSLFLAPAEAAAVMLPILCVMDAFGVRAYWGKWATEELRVLIPGALLGIVLGSLVFGLLSAPVLKGLIGCIAVLFSLDRLLGLRARLRWHRAPGRVAGTSWAALSGLTSTLAHAGGPPVLVYLLGRQLDKERFIATTVVFFTVVNAAKILPYLALGLFSRPVLGMAGCLAILAPVGVWLGVRLQKAVPERPFFYAASLMLGCSGLKLLWDAAGA